MEEFWILISVALFAINSLDKAESVKLELKTFDEIFGEGWWDKGEAEDLKTPALTNFGQNVHHQIDRQNTQIGQIEPNSTDQNPPLTGSDHKDERKRREQQHNRTTADFVKLVESLALPLLSVLSKPLEALAKGNHRATVLLSRRHKTVHLRATH
uniref:Uncharacterized protein n=1 Tax=Globodera rostochiensis TaxID=31243 RepID=A0A914HPP5_GLORO